jgi:DNA-binding GntR family transcriptional regulator
VRPRNPQLTGTEIVAQLRALNADLAEAGRAARPNPPRLFDLDAAFHRYYVEAGAGTSAPCAA